MSLKALIVWQRLRWWALASALAILVAELAVVAAAYAAAANWTDPRRTRASITPAEYGLEFEDVRLPTEDGLQLAAWYIPSRNRSALVVAHGLHGNRGGDHMALVRALAERGYGALVIDLRGHGDSDGTRSSLSYKEVRDVRAAVRYLEEREGVDPSRIGAIGFSLGAATVIMAGPEIPELRFVVADSSFASLEWIVANQLQNAEQVPQWLGPIILSIGSLQMGVDAREIAPVKRIARISPRPVMIIHGELDELFVVENARVLAAAAQEPKEVWIQAGIHHVKDFPPAYADRVAEFIERALS